MSVPTFLQAFRHFVARRGLPSQIVSDNAKTFKGAAIEIQRVTRSTEVQRYMTSKGVIWKFIVEKAPWQGAGGGVGGGVGGVGKTMRETVLK